MTEQKEHKQEKSAMLLQYKRAQDSAMIRGKGAKGAAAAGLPGVRMADEHDLGDWHSNDGGSFSDYDSDEEIRRLKRRRRRLRAKREQHK